MYCVAEDRTQSVWRRIAGRALMWSGFASGVALTILLGYIAFMVHGHGRSLMLLMVGVNLLMLTPWQWRALPAWLYAGLAVARGFHWAVNLMFGSLGLLLLVHAGAPRRALAFGIVSMMFVLWAAAARRLTRHGAVAQD